MAEFFAFFKRVYIGIGKIQIIHKSCNVVGKGGLRKPYAKAKGYGHRSRTEGRRGLDFFRNGDITPVNVA